MSFSHKYTPTVQRNTGRKWHRDQTRRRLHLLPKLKIFVVFRFRFGFPAPEVMVGTRSTPHSNGDDENGRISEPVPASRAEDFGRVEEALAAREVRLQREIEKLRRENALLEEKREFERLEKLKAEAELRESLVKAEEVSGDPPPPPEEEEAEKEKDDGNEVISQDNESESRILRRKKGGKRLRKRMIGNVERRRSQRLAAIENFDSSAPVEGNEGRKISGYGRVLKTEMKRRNMERKKVGRMKMGEKKTVIRGEDYVQYRCNLWSFFKTMQRIKKHLTKAHLELIKKTPFWPLVFAFYYGLISKDQCVKSESDICHIIKCYNKRTMRFEFGSKSASLTTEDVSEILGLPHEGDELQLKQLRNYRSDFTMRCFEGKKMSKTRVDEALEEAIKGKRKSDIEDVVRLIVMELCSTFLLCSSGTASISSNLVKYIEDLENISRYSWAKAVADLLHKSLKKETRRLNPKSVAGCVVVIMIWLCEKTNLVQPIRGREGKTPAIVKWNMHDLHLKLRHIDVADIGLSFEENKEKKKKNKKRKRRKEENERAHEEAEIDGQEGEEGENMFDDAVGPLEDELRAPTTQTKIVSTPTISTRLDNDNEVLEKGSKDLWEMVQNASAAVNRLTENLESKKEKTKKLKRRLKEEKKGKRKLEEDNEILITEKKSLFGSLRRLVKKLEGSLEAKREEVKNLKKENMELIIENQYLRDHSNRDSPCTSIRSSRRLREGMQIEASTYESNLKRLEKSI